MATWTQQDIDTLKAAIASGVFLVKYEGPPMRVVQYQSTDAMRQLLGEMVAQVADAAGTRTRNRFASVSKGF